MDIALNGDVLTISLSGHIDSSNAAAVEAEINEAVQRMQHRSLVLDMRALEYISSAGLRIILRLLKREPQLSLQELSSEVYEIFDMTGFTEMMPIRKAYRQVSIDGCELIGRGANGTVYRLDRDTVVKVYNAPDCLPDVQRERELARKAFVLGIPTAIPYDVVRVGSKFGSVFELLDAQSLSKLIAAHPERYDEYVKTYVDLMRRLHSTPVKPGDMPNVKGLAQECVDHACQLLSPGQSAKLRALVSDVPDTGTMLHGDYHTNNIVMQNGEALIIDMDTLCIGHPIFELAWAYLACVGYGELDHRVVEEFLGLPYELTCRFWRDALRSYLGDCSDARLLEVEDMVRIVAYARLARRIMLRNAQDTVEGHQTLELCRAQLSALLDRVDSLDFMRVK